MLDLAQSRLQFPYDIPVADLLIAKEDAGVDITVLNVGAGDLTSGGPGIAAVPGREDHFKAAVEEAYEYAATLKPITMNVLSGWPPWRILGSNGCPGIKPKLCCGSI